MWTLRVIHGLQRNGNKLLLCPKTRANEQLGGTRWRRKIPPTVRQGSGGTAALGTQTWAPSSSQQPPLRAVPRAGHRGNLLQGTETRRLSHVRAQSSRYVLLARLFAPVAAAERPGAGAARPPAGSDHPSGSSAQVCGGELCKYSRLKTGKVTADLYLMQMFPMFCSIVLLINKNQPKTKKAFGIVCVTWTKPLACTCPWRGDGPRPRRSCTSLRLPPASHPPFGVTTGDPVLGCG